MSQNELNHQAPRNKVYPWDNKLFMTKTLSKFYHGMNVFKKQIFGKQISLYKTKKLLHISSQKRKKAKFWQTLKPFLSEKNKSREKITLLKMKKLDLMKWRHQIP